MNRLLTRRDALAEIRWDDPAVPEPAEGAVLVEIEAVACTANTFTYGLLGERLRYWDFHPTGEPGWGCLPAWGTGVVLAGDVAGVPVGTRLFGLWPMATHAVLTPTRIGPTAIRDGSAHRAGLPAAYQHYERVPEPDPVRALLHPVFVLAFLLAGELRATRVGSVVLTSASSRTAQAIAQQLPHAEVIGLTAPSRVAACTATGLFDRVLSYSQASGLGGVLVDIAGDADLRRRIGAADTILVGATHRADGALEAGPGERVYSAVDAMRGLRPAELAAAWASYLARCGDSVTPIVAEGRAAVERAYREVLDGRCAADHGHLLDLR
jgi:hypothetical protein